MGKRVVVVTGATGTLGSALFRRLLDEGYFPVLIARDKAALKAAEKEFSGKLATVAGDVSDPSFAEAVFQKPFIHESEVCGIVCCAGILAMGPTESFALENWTQTIAVNLSGTFYMFRAAVPYMKAQGGCLIAIGSRWADGAKQAAAYSASKAGLRGMIAAMQKEFAGSNIRPVLISPGSIASLMSTTVNTQTAKLDILEPLDIVEIILHVLQSPGRVIFSEITLKAYNYDLSDEHS